MHLIYRPHVTAKKAMANEQATSGTGSASRRLTRILLLMGFLIMVVLFWVMMQVFASDTSHGTVHAAGATLSEVQPPHAYVVVVSEGDSLWAISRTHVPKGKDIRQYIEEVRDLNKMKSSQLFPGQKLLLP